MCDFTKVFEFVKKNKKTEYRITNKITSEEKLLKNNLKPVTSLSNNYFTKNNNMFTKKSLFYVSTFEQNLSYEYFHSVQIQEIS